jgi:hypothetical protein
MRRAEPIVPPPFHEIFGVHDSTISFSILVYVSSDWDATSIDLSVSVDHDIAFRARRFPEPILVKGRVLFWAFQFLHLILCGPTARELFKYGPATAIDGIMTLATFFAVWGD